MRNASIWNGRTVSMPKWSNGTTAKLNQVDSRLNRDEKAVWIHPICRKQNNLQKIWCDSLNLQGVAKMAQHVKPRTIFGGLNYISAGVSYSAYLLKIMKIGWQ